MTGRLDITGLLAFFSLLLLPIESVRNDLYIGRKNQVMVFLVTLVRASTMVRQEQTTWTPARTKMKM